MEASKRYRSISYLKSNTSDVAKENEETSSAVVITRNGIPAFVCISMDEYYQNRETNALLKLLHMGEREVIRGNVRPISDAKSDLNGRVLGQRK